MRKTHANIFLVLILIFISQNVFSQFVENKGQLADLHGNLHPEILFRGEIAGANIYFKKNSIEYNFLKFEPKSEDELTEQELHELSLGNHGLILDKMYIFRVDFEFLGANSDIEIIPMKEGLAKRNYYLAHCPDGILDVGEYFQIKYKNIYDNIDLIFYSKEGYLKYDFVIHPGGNPDDIRLRYVGHDSITKTGRGDLQINTKAGAIAEEAPFCFVYDDNSIIQSRFVVEDDVISFQLDGYDNSQKIVIDPVVKWATYYNNSNSSDTWTRPVIDSNGSLINVGYTYAGTYTIVDPGGGAWIDPTRDGSVDLIIVRFNSAQQLVWATYYGGNNSDFVAGHTDYGKALAIDENDNIFIAGHVWTGGTNTFPTLNPGGGAFYQTQSKIHGTTSFFLKFDVNGVRIWATMFQHENANTNSSGMRINGIAARGSKVYFTGETYRSNNNDIPLRTLAGAYNNSTYVGDQDAFIGRFNSNGVLEWCTYLNCGNTLRKAYSQGCDLHVDNSGNLLFVGRESFSGNQKHLMLSPGGGAYYQTANAGDQDLTITKFNSSLQPVWSTYYGGSAQDIPSMISADELDNILIVCRFIRSTDFPCFNPGGGAYFQGTKAANGTANDGAIMKFSPGGVRQWATYYGGGGTYTSGASTYDAYTTLTGIGANQDNTIFVSGETASPSFPTQNEAGSYYSGIRNGQRDAVFMKFTNAGVRQWATYYGGSGEESLYSGKGLVHSDGCETVLVAFGHSNSINFPTVNPGGGAFYESTKSTTNCNVIYMFAEGSSSPPPPVTGPTDVCEGELGVVYSVTPVAGATYVWTVPTGATIVSGQGTNSITVNFGSNGGQVCVTITAPCISATPSCITVNMPTPGGTGLWTWTGGHSTNWFYGCNWDKNTVPTFQADVLIPGATPFQPTITGAMGHCNAIEINSTNGAALTIQQTLGGSLQVHQ